MLSAAHSKAGTFARLFSGKEAVFKTLGARRLAFGNFKEIEVVRDGSRDGVQLTGRVRAVARARRIRRIEVRWRGAQGCAMACAQSFSVPV